MKHINTLFITLLTGLLPVAAQTTREEMAADLNKTGGVYYSYPSDKADNTPAPRGYKAFHISHYGRHGSRYLISDADYDRVYSVLQKAKEANALTPMGINVMNRLDTIIAEAKGRGGDLSPLGRRQHKSIAKRMITNYPEVFNDNSRITARSTLVPRCIISMASFCESLKEKNPKLVIDMESSNRYMPYLCYSTPGSDNFNSPTEWWKEVYRKMEERNTNPDRLINSLFSDKEFIKRYVKPRDLMWGLYWLASDAQNTENKVSLYDIFTADELFDLWQCFNALFYAQHSNYGPAEGKHLSNAKPLLRNVLETAEEAMKSSDPSAALRFGHDGNVVPFVALLGFDNCAVEMDNEDEFYKGWCDWKVSPMGANIQIVFYRNEKNPEDIILKFLHNERETHIPVDTDIWPYYHWQDVKAYYDNILNR